MFDFSSAAMPRDIIANNTNVGAADLLGIFFILAFIALFAITFVYGSEAAAKIIEKK